MTNIQNKHYLHLLRNWSTAEAISDHVIFRFMFFLQFRTKTAEGRQEISFVFLSIEAERRIQRKLNGPENEARESSKTSVNGTQKQALRSTFVPLQSGFWKEISWDTISHNQHCQSSSTHSPLIQNDLSIKVTSCKGRGSCFYFFQHSHTQRSSQISWQLEWMWFD